VNVFGSQCFAVFCSVLQCVAVCCSVLQCVAECCRVVQCFSVLQCVAVCCSVLPNKKTLQLHKRKTQTFGANVFGSGCVVAYYCIDCSMLQCIVVCCSLSDILWNLDSDLLVFVLWTRIFTYSHILSS